MSPEYHGDVDRQITSQSSYFGIQWGKNNLQHECRPLLAVLEHALGRKKIGKSFMIFMSRKHDLYRVNFQSTFSCFLQKNISHRRHSFNCVRVDRYRFVRAIHRRQQASTRRSASFISLTPKTFRYLWNVYCFNLVIRSLSHLRICRTCRRSTPSKSSTAPKSQFKFPASRQRKRFWRTSSHNTRKRQ